MKKPSNLTIIAICLVVLAFSALTVYAVTQDITKTSTHSSTVNIIPTPSPSPVPSLTFTESLNSTVIANNAPIDFGSIQAGTTQTDDFLVMNTGNVNAVFNVTASNLPAGVTVAWSSQGLEADAGTPLDGSLTIAVAGTATGGSVTFTLTVTATQTT